MRLLTVSALLLALLPSTARAQVENRVRLQGIISNPTGKFAVGNLDLDAADAWGGQLAWEVLFAEKLGLELAAATANHDIKFGFGPATSKVGELRVTPTTASVLYQFRPDAGVDPYVGGGAAYVFYGDVSSDDLGDLRIDDDFTFTVQAGVDLRFGGAWGVSGGLKYVDTDAVDETGEALPIDLVIISAGALFRF